MESDCRVCHESGLPDRHHLAGQAQNKGCLDCHTLVFDNNCQCLVFDEFRDCLVCHIYPDAFSSPPHHNTQDAVDRHCSACHGSVVQDFDDDHYVPDYDISSVTPDPVCKTWNGPICVSGGCYVCHTGDSFADPEIVDYKDLHHEVRLNCYVCHNMHGNIRDCEICHSPDSLHNIQADSDNPLNPGTIIPGEEDLGWGHIGNGWDCFGCHESFNTSSVTPQTGATVPTIFTLSANSVTAGSLTEIVVYGNGFINITDGIPFISDVILNNGMGTIMLEKVWITESNITVTIPPTLSAGLYELLVVKDNKKSNKTMLNVVPPVLVSGVNCNRKMGVLTVQGAGFNERVPGTDNYINVQVNGVPVDIIFWSDTLIKASASMCENNAVITVNALMGSASSGGGKQPRPCKGKKC